MWKKRMTWETERGTKESLIWESKRRDRSEESHCELELLLFDIILYIRVHM